jgi:hypothetical protein
MAHQVRRLVCELSANVTLYRLALLGLALVAAVVPLGIPGGGGGGVG